MTSLDKCMQARITHAHSFYLGIDDFEVYLVAIMPRILLNLIVL